MQEVQEVQGGSGGARSFRRSREVQNVQGGSEGAGRFRRCNCSLQCRGAEDEDRELLKKKPGDVGADRESCS